MTALTLGHFASSLCLSVSVCVSVCVSVFVCVSVCCCGNMFSLNFRLLGYLAVRLGAGSFGGHPMGLATETGSRPLEWDWHLSRRSFRPQVGAQASHGSERAPSGRRVRPLRMGAAVSWPQEEVQASQSLPQPEKEHWTPRLLEESILLAWAQGFLARRIVHRDASAWKVASLPQPRRSKELKPIPKQPGHQPKNWVPSRETANLTL